MEIRNVRHELSLLREQVIVSSVFINNFSNGMREAVNVSEIVFQNFHCKESTT